MTALDRFRAKAAELFGPQLDLLSSRYTRDVPSWYRSNLAKRAKVEPEGASLAKLTRTQRRRLMEANRRVIEAAEAAGRVLSSAVDL